MWKSIHQDTQEILGIIVFIKCEPRADAVFCVLKNKFARNADVETESFLSTAYSSNSYNPLFVTPQLVAIGEDSDVAAWGLVLRGRCQWEQVTIFKWFGFLHLLTVFLHALPF